jgi:hypothetical protein
MFVIYFAASLHAFFIVVVHNAPVKIVNVLVVKKPEDVIIAQPLVVLAHANFIAVVYHAGVRNVRVDFV